MTASFGKNFRISIFGESHGTAIGAVLDGIPAGTKLDMAAIEKELKRRAPGQHAMATPRKENDTPEIVSGFFDGHTTGTPLTVLIRNTNTRSKDYSVLRHVMRPGQVDYSAQMRYGGFQDYRGSGHFSGRITAPLVFAGAIAKQILAERGITIGAHISSLGTIKDAPLDFKTVTPAQLEALRAQTLPLVDGSKRASMEEYIAAAKAEGDSVGGTITCMILGVPAGVGNPFFDSVEAVLAHLLYSVPAVKGLTFGSGFDLTEMKGSEANDSFCYDEHGEVRTRTNHNGGLIGGITTGMPIQFTVAIKPPASIGKAQQTINIVTGQEAMLEVEGRHDPVIIPRAMPVIEAVAAIGILDLLMDRVTL